MLVGFEVIPLIAETVEEQSGEIVEFPCPAFFICLSSNEKFYQVFMAIGFFYLTVGI
jgi:hypothetical protein